MSLRHTWAWLNLYNPHPWYIRVDLVYTHRSNKQVWKHRCNRNPPDTQVEAQHSGHCHTCSSLHPGNGHQVNIQVCTPPVHTKASKHQYNQNPQNTFPEWYGRRRKCCRFFWCRSHLHRQWFFHRWLLNHRWFLVG